MSAIAAAAFVMAAPAYAAIGYVGGSYVNSEVSDDNTDGGIIEGAVAFDIAPTLGSEVDVYGSEIEEEDAFGINGHIYADTGAYKFGGFAGVGEADDESTYAVGIEGAAHLNNFSVLGAFGYGETDSSDDGMFAADAVGRFFLTDDFMINGRVGWSDSDADNSPTAYRFGAGAEFQFAALPVSAFANFDRQEIINGADTDTIRIGARYHFGTGTLRDRDLMGPTFAGVSSLAGY
jgi:hypothetical protein